MKAIVFSRDRPMQLDLLLTSLERNAPHVFDVHVLYDAREWRYEEGYAICESEHPDTTFLDEDGITYQVRSLIQGTHRVIFFTDDSILYRPLPELPELLDGWLTFSLRLGENTTYCYPHAREQLVPTRKIVGKVAQWAWQGAEGDFGYPMSLDGHIFREHDIVPLLRGRNFSNPNWLEEILMRQARSIGRPGMASFYDSHLVGVPVNRVNETMTNRFGDTYSYPTEELNERYLAGERIDLDALDFSDIRGAHQEIKLAFR